MSVRLTQAMSDTALLPRLHGVPHGSAKLSLVSESGMGRLLLIMVTCHLSSATIPQIGYQACHGPPKPVGDVCTNLESVPPLVT